MAELSFSIKHTDVMWTNWLAQFVGKKKLEEYVKSFCVPFDTLETTLDDMTNKRGVDTAVGAQLDGVGVIVGQPRYVPGAFLLPFFGYLGQPSITGYDQARYRRMGESNEDANSYVGDPEYRTLIKWKIAVNSAGGTIPDIIRALRVVFPNAVRIIITEPATRHVDVTVRLDRQPNQVFANNLEMFIPVQAGVRVTARIEII